MCGIAGAVAPGKSGYLQEIVRGMTDCMHRRGPDSEGFAAWPNAALGHRRLSIIDLSSAGHQPMLSDNGEIGLVFNGCVYNFREIRAELEALGHHFRSHTDTEVLLRGYQQWGIDQLMPKLRGMFAFAIWDNPEQKLTMVRDRLGVKPLIYCRHNGEIAFASTMEALRTVGLGGEVEPSAVLDLLEFGFVTDKRSIYRGISKLPPATIAEWQDGNLVQREYWSVPSPDAWSNVTFDEAVEETERLLLDAVQLRLVADVPIGVLLSGGIDSSLVCWALQKLNANVKAFTVRASDDPSDESADAAETARQLGIEHEIVDMPRGEFSLDQLTDAYSEPFPCSSAQAMLWVSSAVKKRATVLLTGDGGDDVYLGYPLFNYALMSEKAARSIPLAVSPLVRAAANLLPESGRAKRLRSAMSYATGGIGSWMRRRDGLPYFETNAMLGEKLAGLQLDWRQLPESAAAGRRLFRDVFESHIQLHFTSEFMPKVDGATMHYAIESRAPFLDQKMWEFAAMLSPEVRLQGGVLKAVLRKIAATHLSRATAQRPKQGFVVPVERWLATRWSAMLSRLQDGTVLESEGWIARGSLAAPINAAKSKGEVPVQIWRLLVLESWLEKQRQIATTIASAKLASCQT
ncbi:MAG: asparagine synthase (glutamine-hydrolyzing) [Acetobacteraceae bacterium]|nr:asparagine synthase (glutamine-hydrolyzing) [Acetobacteraceae bacterium]